MLKVSCACCTHVLKNFHVNDVTYDLVLEVTVFVILAFLVLAVQLEIIIGSETILCKLRLNQKTSRKLARKW